MRRNAMLAQVLRLQRKQLKIKQQLEKAEAKKKAEAVVALEQQLEAIRNSLR